ncbi:hypothetical protein [Lentzea kentuckyensis]|uniref:hypothetical protein n=1 Tax=Lentzea kentuckyensis TaxID=360086 RepID=UPI001302168E|nr:hypothetical protein [Lentzea kentuckyensis]
MTPVGLARLALTGGVAPQLVSQVRGRDLSAVVRGAAVLRVASTIAAESEW